MSQRIERVDELLRQEIGALLAKEVQDPHIGFATVTDVEATPDLRHARVWISVIGGAPERRDTIAALERAMPFIRHELGTRLRIRRIPALHVVLDDSHERATRVLRILDDLERGEEPGAALPGESLPTPVARLPREGDAPEPVGETPARPTEGSPSLPASPAGGTAGAPGRGQARRRGPGAVRGAARGGRPGRRAR